MINIEQQKESARIRARTWYHNNKSKARDNNTKWKQLHPEQTKAIARKATAKWTKNNSKEAINNRKQWRHSNPDKAKNSYLTWKRNHASEVLSMNRAYRARKFNAPGGGVTTQEWTTILNNSLGFCAYCNTRSKLTMDHIEPLSLGGKHDMDNIVAVCKSCNSSKGDTPLVQWLIFRRNHVN